MTCIAGIAQAGKVYLGGDNVSTIDGTRVANTRGKVFRHGEFVIGHCGNSRFGEIVRYAFNPPEVGDQDLSAYMATTFTRALRATLRDEGYLWVENGRAGDDENALLVGVRGLLFFVGGDFSSSAVGDGVFAIGCGMPYALGALFVTEELRPEDRLRAALEAAERYSSGVRRPFDVVSVP